MNNLIKSSLTLGLVATAMAVFTLPVQAEVHSKSKELVVLEPRDLPEPAQLTGNSLFLHSDSTGSTYLYVEQQQGARLSVFDVTDPARIKLETSTTLPAEGPFDFIRPIGDHAELVYFREGGKIAVLDLRKAKKPALHAISIVTDLGSAETLGQSGFLASGRSYRYIPAVARDYQVVDISVAEPAGLITVKDVKHRVTNDETGTTFLLGSNGLTVVRRLDVENDYKVHQMQMQGN